MEMEAPFDGLLTAPCVEMRQCILRFHCHAINRAQKKITTRPVEEAKKMKSYNNFSKSQVFVAHSF